MTKDQLKEKVHEIFDDAENVEVRLYDDRIEIDISAMYESPGRDLPKLIRLSEIVNTKEINDQSSFGHGGCDSCDYGSKYGVTLEMPRVVEVTE